MAAETDFVGRGMGFPVRVTSAGSIAWASGADAVDGALRTILGTAPSERVMRPQFGCAVWDLLFDPINANTLGLMEQAVRDAVGQWEPRVELEDVQVRPNLDHPGRVEVDLTYVVRSTNDRRNLVYPFYAIAQEPAP